MGNHRTGNYRSMPVEELADRLEIIDLYTRYARAIDTKDWDLLDTVFTPDSHLDYSTAGDPRGVGDYPTVKAWLAEVLPFFPMTQHLVSNVDISFGDDGDTAHADAMVYNPMGYPGSAGERKHFFCGGWYRDDLVRTPDGWRVYERFEDTQWFSGDLPGA